LHSVISKHDVITQLLLAHHSELVRDRLNSARKLRGGGGGGGGGRDPGTTEDGNKRSSSRRLSRRASGGGWLTSGVSDLQAMLDQRDFSGKAALHHAVADTEERHHVVQNLLAAKSQVNIRDARGNSPLHIACQHGHIHIVKTLIIYSANSGSKNEELMTPLHIASLNLRMKIVSVLLKENQAGLLCTRQCHGGMVTAEDARGWTPLHYACRALAMSESSTSCTAQAGLNLMREEAEDVVQQLLRHGADLHSLDKTASKPLDFRKYFGERRDDIMQAVQDTLQYKLLSARQIFSSVQSLPERAALWITGATDAWNESSPAQARQRLVYQQSKQRYHAGRSIFSSARVQEAVHEEWIQGGHRIRALRVLLLYLVYLVVFTLRSVLNSGRNMPHGYHLTMSIRSAIEIGSGLWDEEESLFGTRDSAASIWEWLQGPVVDLVYADTNNSWYEGDTLVNSQGWEAVRILGQPRLSQWRTASDSCETWPLILAEEELSSNSSKFCFTDYCGEDSGATALCHAASMDARPFGPNFKYEYVPDAHKDKIKGSFGVYGPGAFVHYVPTEDRELAESGMEELEADGWIDESSRAVSLELAIHSFSGRQLVYVRILIELPAEGGVPLTHPSYVTFSTFNSFHTLRNIMLGPRGAQYYWLQLGHDGGGVTGDRLAFLAELALLMLVLVNIGKERMELRRQGPYYFLAVTNLLDIVLIVGHGILFYILVAKSTAVADLDLVDDQETDIRHADPGIVVLVLADLVAVERQCVATMVILVWVKLMDPLQGVFQDFFLLVKMIALMIGKLVRSFLPLLAIIYVAWAFARYTLLGELEFLMKSISSAVATQYPETLGEFTFDDIRAENLYQSWRYSFTALFTMLVVVIMLNLLVSLLNDLYEELKSLATADWCRAQATTIYMNARWHSQQQRQQRLHQRNKQRERNSMFRRDGLRWCPKFPSLPRWLAGLDSHPAGAGPTTHRAASGDSERPSSEGDKGVEQMQARQLLRLKEKAATLGRDHLELASRAEGVEAAAVLASITDALDVWEKHALHAADKGETSPLPPVEALRKLHRLLMDGEERGNSGGKNQPTHVCRTLLRANILMSLAGIISADGRRAHARHSSAHFPGRRFSALAQSHGTSPRLSGVGEALQSSMTTVRQWVSNLTGSLTSSGTERRQSWNEARKLSIKIARVLVEFPLSPAAAGGDSSAAAGQENNTAHPKVEQVRAARFGGPRNGRPGHHHYHDQGAAAKTNTATRAPVAPGGTTNRTTSEVQHRTRNSSGACSSPAETDNVYGGWWGEGDEVLRTMGGGFLTIACLSTLSRAIPSPATRPVAGTPSTPHGSGTFTNHHHKSPHHHNNDVKDVFGQYEVSQEVSDLLLLLAALFRLGSPPSQVPGGISATLGGVSPSSSTTAPAPGGGAVNAVLPPTVTEVEAALAAGMATASRRRRSSSATTPPLTRPAQQDRSKSVRTGGVKGRLEGKEEGVARGRGNSTKHDPESNQTHPERSVVFQGLGNGRGEAGSRSAHTARPRQPRSNSMRAAIETPPSTPSSFPGKGGGRGPDPATSAVPMSSSLLPSDEAPSERMVVSEPRRQDSHQGMWPSNANSSRGSFANSTRLERTPQRYSGAPSRVGVAALEGQARRSGTHRVSDGLHVKSRQSLATGEERRIPAEAFEMCGGGNFAVYLAACSRSLNRESGRHERGFETLAHLALREAHPFLISSSSYRRPGGKSVNKGGGATKRKRWKGPVEVARSRKNVAWWTTGDFFFPSAATCCKETGQDGPRRGNGGPVGDTSLTTHSKAFFGSASDEDGVGVVDISTVTVARRAQHLPILLTGIIKDHFLTQVRTLLEGDTPGRSQTGDESAAASGLEGPSTRIDEMTDSSSATSLSRRTSFVVSSLIGRGGSPTPRIDAHLGQVSHRSSCVRMGAALAYQVSVGGVFLGGVGCPSDSDGSEALVDAGMVVVLMRVAAAAAKPPSLMSSGTNATERGPSARVLAIACLTAVITKCRIDDDTAATPVRSLDAEAEGARSNERDGLLWGWDGGQESGPVLLLTQAMELGCLFMDIMLEGLAFCNEAGAEEDEGGELAERSITGLHLLLRACEAHDWELTMAGINVEGASEGAHGVMVDAIRCHSRGYPSLELMAEGTKPAKSEEHGWISNGNDSYGKIRARHRSPQQPQQRQSGNRSLSGWWGYHFGRGKTTSHEGRRNMGGLHQGGKGQTRLQRQGEGGDVENLAGRGNPSSQGSLASSGVAATPGRRKPSGGQARVFPRG
ncbi:unnamed protein product, partial [Ectocarpus sp. 12 AP-2014]